MLAWFGVLRRMVVKKFHVFTGRLGLSLTHYCIVDNASHTVQVTAYPCPGMTTARFAVRSHCVQLRCNCATLCRSFSIAFQSFLALTLPTASMGASLYTMNSFWVARHLKDAQNHQNLLLLQYCLRRQRTLVLKATFRLSLRSELKTSSKSRTALLSENMIKVVF